VNLPNYLTLARIFLVPLLVAALVQDRTVYTFGPFSLGNESLALAIFLIAALTDLLDGYLARKWSQITTLGTLLDPVADKLLVSAALIALVEVKAVPAWMVILTIGRDFAISGLRNIASSEGYVIPASDLGKSKMILQVTAIALIMLGMRWPDLAAAGLYTMYAAVIFTMISAVDYTRQFWRKVDVGIKLRRRKELLLLERTRRRAARAAAKSGAKSNAAKAGVTN
jgi:CDP-diacylglycerol---glycerol-3-phosphate 3-phosphatidyltransferase